MYTVLGKIKKSLSAYPKPNITGYVSPAVKHFSKADLKNTSLGTAISCFRDRLDIT